MELWGVRSLCHHNTTSNFSDSVFVLWHHFKGNNRELLFCFVSASNIKMSLWLIKIKTSHLMMKTKSSKSERFKNMCSVFAMKLDWRKKQWNFLGRGILLKSNVKSKNHVVLHCRLLTALLGMKMTLKKTKMKIKGTKVSKLSLNSWVFLWENLLINENKKLCTVYRVNLWVNELVSLLPSYSYFKAFK